VRDQQWVERLRLPVPLGYDVGVEQFAKQAPARYPDSFRVELRSITDLYAKPMGPTLYLLFGAVASLLIIILSPKNDWSVAAALFTLVAVTILSMGKSLLRMNAVQLVLPEYANKLRRQTLPQLTLWCVAPFIFLFNCIAAWMSRRIAWRGTVYEMISSNETRVVNKISR